MLLAVDMQKLSDKNSMNKSELERIYNHIHDAALEGKYSVDITEVNVGAIEYIREELAKLGYFTVYDSVLNVLHVSWE